MRGARLSPTAWANSTTSLWYGTFAIVRLLAPLPCRAHTPKDDKTSGAALS